MRLWIYTSGGEAFPLFNFLKRHNHDVVLYVDRNVRPIDDKWAEYRWERMELFFDAMKDKKVDVVIVPPMVECTVMNGEYDPSVKVLPLFTTYLENSAFKHSLVGKIGLLAEPVDFAACQSVIETIAAKSEYRPTKWRSRRVKQVPLWKYYLTHLSVKDWMVRKTIKTDLRYMKNAAVDTLIPTSWAHFWYQAMIKHMVSWKHMRFHGLDALNEAFEECCHHAGSVESNEYSLEVVTVGDAGVLLDQKRNRVLLGI